MATEVIHIKDHHYSDVYIGRPSIFGNPFVLEKEEDREHVLITYQEYFYNRIKNDAIFRDLVENLRDKRLYCYCKPKMCHGDIIADYLNNNAPVAE